jgi:hypothetical protein
MGGTNSNLKNHCHMTTSTIVPTTIQQGVLDSGCTSNLITSSTKCINKVLTTHGLRVGIPNGHSMQASQNAKLDLQHLPIQLNSSARDASVQPDLQKSLVSLGQLCDNGCDYVLLDKHYVSVIKDGITSVIGLRDPTNGMWLVDLEPSGLPTPLPSQHPTYQHCAYSAYEQKTKVQLIDFLHRACFSPPISTWTQAIEKKKSPPGPVSPPTPYASTFPNPSLQLRVTSKPLPRTFARPPKYAPPTLFPRHPLS